MRPPAIWVLRNMVVNAVMFGLGTSLAKLTHAAFNPLANAHAAGGPEPVPAAPVPAAPVPAAPVPALPPRPAAPAMPPPALPPRPAAAPAVPPAPPPRPPAPAGPPAPAT